MKTKIPKYFKYKKNLLWYFVVLMVFGFGYFYAVNQNDLVQIIILSLLVIALGAYLMVEPNEVDFIVGEEGFSIGENHYPFANVRGFITVLDDPVLSVHFFTFSKFKPTVKVTIEDKKDAHKLLTLLQDRLEFLEDEKEPLVDYYMRLFRF